MKKKQYKKLMEKLGTIQAELDMIERRLPPPKPVEFRAFKTLPTSLSEEWLINHINNNGNDQPCPPQPKGEDRK